MTKLIELKNISYSRPNGQICANNLNFTFSTQQKVAITGSNGSGKSTMLQLILGLLDNTQGEVTLFSHECKTEDDFVQHRTKIGYLFQDPDDQLFCPTVLEDVCFGPVNQGFSQDEAKSMAMNTLKELGIERLAHQASYHLSGGEKRLASLAAILVMQPQILLLDEPTNGLDKDNYQLFIKIIQDTKLPLILISHDPNLRSELTDTEYYLQNGTLTSK